MAYSAVSGKRETFTANLMMCPRFTFVIVLTVTSSNFTAGITARFVGKIQNQSLIDVAVVVAKLKAPCFLHFCIGRFSKSFFSHFFRQSFRLPLNKISELTQQGGESGQVVGRLICNPEVPGSNPPPCHWMDLSSVDPNSTPSRFVKNKLVSLPPVGILNLLCLICIICLLRAFDHIHMEFARYKC